MTDILYEMKKFISECWENIFAEVCGTVVYIDHNASECLHWHTAGRGYLTLKDAGAIAIHELGMYHFRVGTHNSYVIIDVSIKKKKMKEFYLFMSLPV